MQITKINWQTADHNCLCVSCNTQQAVFIVHTGQGWNLPVCPNCVKLNEKLLIKKINGGQNDEVLH